MWIVCSKYRNVQQTQERVQFSTYRSVQCATGVEQP